METETTISKQTRTGGFKQKFEALVKETLEHIRRYDGPKSIVLSTGEKAIDMDDSWLILETLTLRNKRYGKGSETPLYRDLFDIEAVTTVADNIFSK